MQAKEQQAWAEILKSQRDTAFSVMYEGATGLAEILKSERI